MDHLSRESSPEVYSYMLDFISRVAEHVLRKESLLRERMGSFMGGQVIRTRTDDIIELGIRQGIKQGIEQGIRKTAERMLRGGKLSHAEIASFTGLTEENIREIEETLMIHA